MHPVRRPRATLVAALVLASFGCKDSAAPPTAQSIAAVPGLAASAVAGSALPTAPSVKVVDGSGKGFAGTTVTFTVTGGRGRITTLLPTVVTDADGIAAIMSWTLGQDAGPNTLTAAAEGLTGSPVTFTVLGVAGPPAAMNPSAGNAQSGTVGAPVATLPAVKVTDINANPEAGVPVTFAIGLGGGSITGANATTDANGIATVGSWTMGTAPGANTLTATAPQLQPVLFGVPASAAAATKLVIATQPPLVAFNNVALATQPVIRVEDVYGNVATSASLPVTAAIVSGVGTLGGTMTVNAVGGVAAFTDLVVSGVSDLGNIRLGFSAPSVAGATSVSVATATSVNLSVDGLYITQSTQSYTRGVPLVAGRAGLLRVFVKASGPNTFAPPVRVRLYQGADLTTPVQTYTINAPSSSVPTGVDEATLGSSWNVAIPANVLTTGLSILADVDPAGTVSDARVDNVFPVSGVPLPLDVRAATPYKVMFVPVIQPGVAQGSVTAANVPTYMDFAMRVYPLPGYDAVVHAPFSYGAQLASAYDATWTELLSQVNAMRVAEAPERDFYGVIHPAYSFGGTGLGYIGAAAAIGVDWLGGVEPSTNYRSMTAAHEWGHNFGRAHIDCGGPANPDPGYPYDPATIGVVGYDIFLGEPRATSLADLMSYCSPLWISDYTYKAVLNARAAIGNGAATGPAPQHGMLVWGRIGPSGVVLEPSFEVDAPPSLPRQRGAYTVRATDDAGGEVFSISFDGVEIDHVPGERHFAYVVPMAANGRKPAMIRLAANGREAIRSGAPAAVSAGASASAIASVRALPAAAQRSRLQWDASSYSMALVRDPATGQVLAFARGGQIDVAAPGQSLDVTLSDGVSSVRKIVAIPPR